MNPTTRSALVLATALSFALTADLKAQVIQSGSQATITSSNVLPTGPIGPAIVADNLSAPADDMIWAAGTLVVNGAPAPVGTYTVVVIPASPPAQPNATVSITYGTSFINITLPVQNTGPTHAGAGIDYTNPVWVPLPGTTYASQGTSPFGGDIAFFNGTIWVNGGQKQLNGVNYPVTVTVHTIGPPLSVLTVTWGTPTPLTVQIMIL